ncbi:MAG TPA: small ribosomal subunit Rsm22 family protein [Nitrolancea sp.]|nr:small ribosomal subunit Rsm22 family protein [Nitrolancea sp.]
MLVDLPPELRGALESQLRGIPEAALSRATQDLSRRYRRENPADSQVELSAEDVEAYAAYRLPATYAATVAVLTALREQKIDWYPRSLLDLGAGLGSGLWAASVVWPSIEQMVAVDSQPSMIAIGRNLSRAASRLALRTARWVQSDLRGESLDAHREIVLLAYVLSEIEPTELTAIVDRAWDATTEALVVIEPGTPAGYERVRLIRDHLATRGGYSLAPCPHDPPCTVPTDDWCHFSVRVPRSRMHRVAKDASLSYEDEKFSYVVMSRSPVRQSYSRILRHPQIRKGHIYLQLCTSEGVKTVVVPKSDRERFNRARKASWGDIFE